MRQRLARARIVCIIRICHHAPVARASASPNVIARTAYGAISFASHVLDAMRANVREACASSWNAARDARERSDSRFELLT